MNRVIFSIAMVVLLASCIQLETITNQSVLHKQYTKYQSLLSKGDSSAAIDMLSKRNIDDLTSHSSKEEFFKYFPVISTINQVFLEEQGGFEVTNDRSGCLTVFGIDSSKEPTSMNMEYVSEEGAWKLDYVQVMYHGSMSELPKKAKCPTRM